ncbi:MAG: hypothetical protein ACJ8C4_21655 [Gemmataceae bacterium]
MFLRLLSALLRLGAIIALVAAAWLGWWILQQRPAKEVKSTWGNGGTSVTMVGEAPPASNHIVYTMSEYLDSDSKFPGRSVYLADLEAAKGYRLLAMNEMKAPEKHFTTPRLSWFVRVDDNGVVEVVNLPQGDVRFALPALRPRYKGPPWFFAHFGASDDDRYLAVLADADSVLEVWDVPKKQRRLRVEKVTG